MKDQGGRWSALAVFVVATIELYGSREVEVVMMEIGSLRILQRQAVTCP